ncbi:MAG: hypothetical protein K6U02_00750 [Firmicutes bacterium]|nr:hypothetical protein [Bacillota bacterium]
MKPLVKALALVCVASLLAWAGDPWKEKPYTEWNEKDVQKVLNDSPWARTVRVAVSWRPLPVGTEIGSENGAPAPQPAGVQPAGEMGLPSAAPVQSGAPPSPSEVALRVPQAEFLIRWVSSLTVRQALVRNAELAGNPLPDPGQLLQAQPDSFQILVLGADLSPFAGVTEAELQARAGLHVGSTKKKVAPVAVQLLRSQAGGRLQGVLFQFPRREASGEAVVPANEKSLEFFCSVKSLNLRAKFDPRKMTNREGVDL